MVENFKHTVRVGTMQTSGGRWVPVYVQIHYLDGELDLYA